MRKLWVCAVLALGLAGCGQGQQVENQRGIAETASDIKAVFCHEPTGITVEKYLMNLEAGLTAVNTPTQITERKLDANACGYQLLMTLGYGSVQVQLDEQQQILNIGAGYDFTQDKVANMTNLFATIQTIVALHSTEKMGETEIGMLLFKAATDTIQAAGEGGGMAKKDVEHNGYLYTVAVEGKTFVIAARKKP